MGIHWEKESSSSLVDVVTPHPPLRRMMGTPHGTRTPLPDFFTLVGPF